MNQVIEKQNIENLIYEIRGKQVMLDSDLAWLYNVETKRINEAVKNNIEKFPERFSWRLTIEETINISRSKFSTLKIKQGSNIKYGARVFTEQGVMMLATILKSKIAVETTIRIMDAFVLMKKYISNDHTEDIKLLKESFNKLSEKRKDNEIFFNGQIYDAYSKILNIFKSTKKELIIVDAYADNTTLDIIKRLSIKVTIITKTNNLLTKQDIEKYNKQYKNLKVIFNNTFHDRYFILDNKEVYYCGTSINRIGYKTFGIALMNDEETYIPLLNRINQIINKS